MQVPSVREHERLSHYNPSADIFWRMLTYAYIYTHICRCRPSGNICWHIYTHMQVTYADIYAHICRCRSSGNNTNFLTIIYLGTSESAVPTRVTTGLVFDIHVHIYIYLYISIYIFLSLTHTYISAVPTRVTTGLVSDIYMYIYVYMYVCVCVYSVWSLTLLVYGTFSS